MNVRYKNVSVRIKLTTICERREVEEKEVGSLDSITLLMTVSPDSEISVSTPMNKL